MKPRTYNVTNKSSNEKKSQFLTFDNYINSKCCIELENVRSFCEIHSGGPNVFI